MEQWDRKVFVHGIWIICVIVTCSAQYYSGDKCIDSRDCEGVCRAFAQCPRAQQELRKGIRPMTCGFERGQPVVCCVGERGRPMPVGAITPTPSPPPPPQPPPPASTQPTTLPGEKAKAWCEKYLEVCPFRIAVAGGIPASPYEFPHMASIGYGPRRNIKWKCGGILISENFVLTAAHCLRAGRDGQAQWVLLGTVTLASNDSSSSKGGQIHGIFRRMRHPGYKPPAKYNDVALLEIGPAVTKNPKSVLSEELHPACLSTDSKNPKSLIATGWGRVGFGEDPSQELLKVELDVFDVAQCNETFETEIKTTNQLKRGIDSTMICAGILKGGKDTCQGDSGGPLQSTNSWKCQYYVWGITSFGKVCAFANSPSIYTRVSAYVEWIESIVWPRLPYYCLFSTVMSDTVLTAAYHTCAVHLHDDSLPDHHTTMRLFSMRAIGDRGSFLIYISGISLICLLNTCSAQLYAGDLCTDSKDRNGVCTVLSQCVSALEGLIRGVRPMICGFDGKEPVVCCNGSTTTEPTIPPPVTYPPSRKPGDKAKAWCDWYAKDCPYAVVGGTAALPDEFPHMAAVGYGPQNYIQWRCGGSLISENFVLTAAHCLNGGRAGPARWVLLGTVTLASNASQLGKVGQIHEVIQRIKHPGYRPPAKYDDVGLLKIGPALTKNPRDLLSPELHPACLRIEDTPRFSYYIATGWGRVGFGEEPSMELLKVALNVFDESQCNETFEAEIKTTSQLRRGIDSTMLCAGILSGGKDICQGDSGGPLQSFKRSSCIYDIWGITSFGKICSFANSPSVYMKVSAYVGWIEEHVWPD
ncbi:uncharacterized protein LOC124174198 [Ischnura elegans]|uniref:uncharacterized protein LOC124174198 n=1 Tax=Ischnura elegans TaxID=197161 RepID=UPI001ED87FB6|nr:uncharacterized protein LOC124174198 [Ischnura elegans]